MSYRYTKLPTEPPPGEALSAPLTEESRRPHRGSYGASSTGGDSSRHRRGSDSPRGRRHSNLDAPANFRRLSQSEMDAHAIMTARARQHVKVQEEKQLWSLEAGTLHPASPIFGIWNPVMILTVWTDAFVQPFLCTFLRFLEAPHERMMLDVIQSLSSLAWVMYVLDTSLQFIMQTPREDGSGMVIHCASVAGSYVKSVGFRLDLLTVIPWTVIAETFAPPTESLVIGDGSRSLLACSIDLLQLFRVCRLHTIRRLMYRYRNRFHVTFTTHTLVSATLRLVLTLHVIACLWSLVGIANPLQKATWIEVYYSRPIGGEEVGAKPSALGVYLAAFYWALATTTSIGYGDVVPAPVNELEQITTIFLMAVAAMSWSVVIANAVELVKDIHSKHEEKQKTMDQCEKVFANSHLDRHLKQNIREYFEKSYDLELQDSTQKLIARMSPMLQRMIVQGLYADWIEDVPWIEQMSGPCLVQVVLKMENFLYIPAEVIPDHRMTSFVQLGTMFLGGRLLRKGDSWGIDMTLEGYMRRREAGFAMNFVSTLGLTFRNLCDVLEDFPDDAWMVKRVSHWMAVRRKAFQIAAESAEKKQRLRQGRAKKTFLAKSLENSEGQFKEAEYGQLGDDARYTVKQMRERFDEQKERLEDIRDMQSSMEIGQVETRTRVEAIEATLQRNSDSLRTVDQRIAGLEQNMQTLLQMVAEGRASSPVNTTKGRYTPWSR